MSNIKIIVACHKPSILPKNDLFLPVQVGAKLSNKDLKIQKDDDGDNISDKNPTYCELTAQYWAWKNLDADYYGLCHYRRFLCFKRTNAKRNLRDQIEATLPDEYNFSRFGLEDSDEMREIIEANDVVTSEPQRVPQLYTPHGPQSTAYQHWAKHDRALIYKKDLDLMLDILEDVSPEVGKAARTYLGSKTFLGFNCFVMKKALFQQMCEIEFKVLNRLEQKIDLKDYNQQLTRIYGFMAEIISSSFIYYLEQSGKYQIKHVPLVYFNYTDPVSLVPRPKSIPIVFNQADNNPLLFAAIWQSFLDHVSANTKYSVFLVATLTDDLKQAFSDMNQHSNVTLDFLDATMVRDIMIERLGTQAFDIVGKRKLRHPFDKPLTVPVLPILPFLFSECQSAIFLDENILLEDSIDQLWHDYGRTTSMIAGAKDAFAISKVNDIYPETLENRLKKALKRPLDFFNTSAFVWNLEKYRNKYKPKDVIKHYFVSGRNDKIYERAEILNILTQGDIEWISQRYGVWYDSNMLLEKQLPYAPLEVYNDMLSARKNPIVACYMDDDPFGFEYSTLYGKYWSYARKTPCYEALQTLQMKFAVKNEEQKVPIVAKAFPVDSRARGYMTKILPPGSRRNIAMKKVLGKMGWR